MVALILNRQSVPRLGALPQPARRPHVAVVYATRDGEVDVLDGGKPLSWRDGMFSRYAMRYEVDMSDQQRTVEMRNSPPPSATGVYSFSAVMDVGFRVHDPAAVVRRNIVDALPMLYAHLIHVSHAITVRYPVEQSAMAQNALNAHFQRAELIEGCLLLYKCRVRMGPEQAWFRHHRDRAENLMTIADRDAEHQLATAENLNQINLELLKQQGRLLQAQNERAALSNRVLDARELIAIAIERDPSSINTAIEQMMQLEMMEAKGEQLTQQRVEDRIKILADKNLIGKNDAADMLHASAALPSIESSAPPPHASWEDPLPPGPSGGAPPPNAIVPVYLVIDQSEALNGYATYLTEGLQALLDALAERREIAETIRLSVLAYADDVMTQLPLGAVQAGLRLPPVTPGGAARYGVVFERLLERIPRDTEVLKTQSPAVCRPQVMFLGGAQPADGSAWTAPHGRLVDRNLYRGAPDIVACGVGYASPATIAGIATRPELAFVAADPGDVAVAVARFCAFARNHILEYGRAMLNGDVGPLVTTPEGFRPARDLI